MPTVSRTFSVAAPPRTVIAYLTDFAHAAEWDAGTESCTQNGAGPVEVGTTWHNVSKIAGVTAELQYELVEVSDDQLVFIGKNDGSTSTDTISVTPSGTGSEVTYEAHLELHGVAKLAAPAMALMFEKLANDTQHQMTEVLNRL